MNPFVFLLALPLFEKMRVESEKMLKQWDCVFLKVDALEWWKIKKSKKSMEGQQSYWALKMQENWLSVNQILMQLQVIAQKSLWNQSCSP